MESESPLHRNILDNMREGVMSVDSEGRVMTFNPAACRMLAIAQEEAVGYTFAEVFLSREGLDDFNQALLDAVREGQVGQQREVAGQVEGKARTFALTTSYLREENRSTGVIAVFADVTEVRTLRETEQRLAQRLEAQNDELQTAYRELEENNQDLDAALKKVQATRVVATVFVFGLFLAVGLATWNLGRPAGEPGDLAAAPSDGDARTLVVRPQRLVATIALFGRVAAQREVHVASPADGKVAATHFEYGERVAQGQRLVELDTTEVERDLRDAQAARIKAERQFAEVQDWANNPETMRVRRDLSKAKFALDDQRGQVEQSALLLEQGIVAAAEHDAAVRQLHSQTLDYESLQESYASVLAKGDEEALEVARLERDNARLRVDGLEETLARAAIAAPIAGVVLQPQAGGSGGKPLGKGQVVSQGERLLTIGDVGGLAVVGQVDEVDVAKVRAEQAVTIRGDAFPDLELSGRVVRVSRQAGQTAQTPSFEIVAAIEPLAEAARQRLRLGMSARIEVVVLDKADALLVPIAAVDVRGGDAWLRIKDRETGDVRAAQVEAGLTTLADVEILAGLAAGDEVLLGS